VPVEVFMQQRHEKMDFMPSALVFPGGRMDPDDAAPTLLEQVTQAALPEFVPPGLVVAAIRETFEECGILYAGRAGSGSLVTGAEAAALEDKRALLNARALKFSAFVESEGLELSGIAMHPFARWITPWWSGKRFDTHFFIARAPEGQTGMHDGGEAVDSVWFAPTVEALAEAKSRRLLVTPTFACLEQVNRAASVEALLATCGADAFRPVNPWLEHRAEGFRVKYDGLPHLERAGTRVPDLSEALAALIRADLEARERGS
jgi:8-oxo-dGTP pyrophosphatase MutT (NUDIX family)